MDGHGEETTLEDGIGKLEAQGYTIAKKDGKSYIKIGEYYYEIKLENQEVSIAKEKTERKSPWGNSNGAYTIPTINREI